jgi:hypothetical protein
MFGHLRIVPRVCTAPRIVRPSGGMRTVRPPSHLRRAAVGGSEAEGQAEVAADIKMATASTSMP